MLFRYCVDFFEGVREQGAGVFYVSFIFMMWEQMKRREKKRKRREDNLTI